MDMVSTSTSPFSCKICGQKAHGNHFGVISCRACAAFFRRTATSKYNRMECRGGSCNQKNFFCKPCRLKRCRDEGMDSTKFQYSRDTPLKVPGQFQLPKSVETYVGRPEFLLFCGGDSPNSKTLVDVRYLLEEASRLLNLGVVTPLQAENQLKKLTIGYNEFIRVDFDKLEIMECAGKSEMTAMWEYYFITVTKWIMYFDEFQKLNRHLQLTLVQAIWHVWEKLHKYVGTSSYRRAFPQSSPSEVIVNNVSIDMHNIQVDSSWMSDYPSHQVMRFMNASSAVPFDMIGALLELNGSETELTYMFAQLCLEYAGKRYQGDILNVTDRLQEILANDLHYYYINDVGNPRYFYRLNKMMKINGAVQRSIWENRPKIELAQIFNVIKLEFSHPEMFEDSGFC